MNNVPIEKVSQICDVGVIIQSNLKFTSQCSNVIRKAYYVSRSVFTTFRSHEPNFYLKMFTCYVRPILEYACQVWSPVLKTNIDRIERVQRHFTRRICPNGMSYENRLEFLNLKTLESRRTGQDLTLFYKIINDLTTVNVQNCYRFVNRARGHSRHLYKFYSRTDKRKYFWINRIRTEWNNLSNTIVTSRSLYMFKKAIKTRQFVGRGSFYVQ